MTTSTSSDGRSISRSGAAARSVAGAKPHVTPQNATRPARALAAGLSIRPLQDTVRDVLADDTSQSAAAAGLAPEAEDRLLERYASATRGRTSPPEPA